MSTGKKIIIDNMNYGAIPIDMEKNIDMNKMTVVMMTNSSGSSNSISTSNSNNHHSHWGHSEVGEKDEEEDDDDDELELEEIGILKRKRNSIHQLCKRHVCYVSFRCVLSTLMLLIFIILGIIFMSIVVSGSLPFQDTNTDYYDFIVIGAGPAGSVVVNKFVKSGAKVLLLEAGGSTQYDVGGTDSFGGPLSRFDIPLLWSSLMINKTIHWVGYNIHGIVQGKGLGGSGIHTAMIYIRALESDIIKWKLKTWSWKRMLRHYIELEDYDDCSSSSSSSSSNSDSPFPYYHGKGGPLRTTKAPFIDSIAPEFIASAQAYGLEYTSDFNDPNGRAGVVGLYDFNIRDGTRDGVATRLLGPLLKSNPSNFYLQTYATAHRVLLSPNPNPSKDSQYSSQHDSTKTMYSAVGVEYEQNGILKRAYISSSSSSYSSLSRQNRKPSGIVLAAGALLTPKLLLNSGIGPKEVLKAANIEVKVDSPRVGRNAQDHGATQVMFRLTKDIVATYPLAYNIISKWGQYVDAVERSKSGQYVSVDEFGVLGSSGLAAGAFLVSPYATDGVPDIQLTVFPSNIFDHGPSSSIKPPISPWINTTTPKIPPSSNTMIIAVALMYPETRFQIILNNTHPIHSPPYLFTESGQELDDIDLIKMSWGIDQVRKIASTPPLSNLIEEILSPALDITIDMLPSWILANHHPYAHWVGSAAIGSSIETSVIDENTKLHGVDHLYVGDASAIPLLTNGNIHSLVTAMGSQCAELILESHS